MEVIPAQQQCFEDSQVVSNNHINIHHKQQIPTPTIISTLGLGGKGLERDQIMGFSPIAPSDSTKPVDLSNNNNNHNNNNEEDSIVDVGEVVMVANKKKCGESVSNPAMDSLPCNGSVRKLAFSVENILDPNFGTMGLHPTSKGFLSPSDLLHHQPHPNFRFPFKDIHGMFMSPMRYLHVILIPF